MHFSRHGAWNFLKALTSLADNLHLAIKIALLGDSLNMRLFLQHVRVIILQKQSGLGISHILLACRPIFYERWLPMYYL